MGFRALVCIYVGFWGALALWSELYSFVLPLRWFLGCLAVCSSQPYLALGWENGYRDSTLLIWDISLK